MCTGTHDDERTEMHDADWYEHYLEQRMNNALEDSMHADVVAVRDYHKGVADMARLALVRFQKIKHQFKPAEAIQDDS